MEDPGSYVSVAGGSTDRPREMLDTRDLSLQSPQNTLERLADLEDDVVLVQRNDRAPQHLYPRLEDRG